MRRDMFWEIDQLHANIHEISNNNPLTIWYFLADFANMRYECFFWKWLYPNTKQPTAINLQDVSLPSTHGSFSICHYPTRDLEEINQTRRLFS